MPCTKRANSAGPPSPAPLKRRSLDLPAHVGATPGWLLGGMAGCSVAEISAAAALWPAIAQLNDILRANAHAYAEIEVLYRSTITRRPTAEVAARLGAPPSPSPRPAHALLAHAVLASAFVQGADGLPVCPSASASLFEMRVPPFLAGWAAQHVAPGRSDPTRLKLLQLNGYGCGQPPCGPGHALGEERAPVSAGAPARTVFLPLF